MPYVAACPAELRCRTSCSRSRASCAAGDGDARCSARPDLAPAVDLQRRLLTLVIDLARRIERGRLPRLSLPPKYLAAKLARGVPVLAGEPIPLPVAVLSRRCCSSATRWPRAAPAKPPTHIRDAIDERQHRRRVAADGVAARAIRTAIRTGAVHRGLAPDLVWLVAELAVSPFAHALQRAAVRRSRQPTSRSRRRSTAGTTATARPAARGRRWPKCVGGHRMLRCSFCAAGVGADDLRVHLLRRERRAVRHRRAGRGAQGSPRRSLQRLRRLPEDDRRRRSCRRSRCWRSPTSKRWISMSRRWSTATRGRRSKTSTQAQNAETLSQSSCS